jgi:flagellar FliJ protein
MAKSKDPLDLVQMLAEAAELEKSQQVAVSMRSLNTEQQRLAMLERYLEEYRGGAAAAGSSSDINALKTKRNFLEALDKAVQDQGAQVSRLRAQFEQQLDVWRAAKAKANAVEQFAGRKSAKKALEEARREQTRLDESGRWSQTPR